jgi:hypothetical protein
MPADPAGAASAWAALPELAARPLSTARYQLSGDEPARERAR